MFFFSQDLKWWQNLVVLQLIVYLIWLRLRWSWIKTVDQPDDDISRELSLMRLIRMIFQSVGKNPFLLHWTSCAPFRSFYFHLLEVISFNICLKWHFKQTGEGLVNDIISCQWHQRVSGPKAKGLLLNIFVTMINPIHHNQWPQSSGLKQKRKAVRPEASETAARISSSVGLSSSSPFYLFLSSEDKTPSALTRESYLWRNGWQSWSHPMLHHVSSVTVTRAHPSHNSPFIVASSLSS